MHLRSHHHTATSSTEISAADPRRRGSTAAHVCRSRSRRMCCVFILALLTVCCIFGAARLSNFGSLSRRRVRSESRSSESLTGDDDVHSHVTDEDPVHRFAMRRGNGMGQLLRNMARNGRGGVAGSALVGQRAFTMAPALSIRDVVKSGKKPSSHDDGGNNLTLCHWSDLPVLPVAASSSSATSGKRLHSASSDVLPHSSNGPVDSIVAVTFDVFPPSLRTWLSSQSSAVDTPLEAEIRDAMRRWDASRTDHPISVEEERTLLQHAATLQVALAMLNRPAGTIGEAVSADSATASDGDVDYFDFFRGRRVIGVVPSASTIHHATAASSVSSGLTCQQLEAAGLVEAVHTYKQGRTVPLRWDVVVTFVDDSAPSSVKYREAFPNLFRSGTHRFRDWNELQYSLRSMFNRAMCPTTVWGQNDCAASLVRKIFVVVSDYDQIPEWLRQYKKGNPDENSSNNSDHRHYSLPSEEAPIIIITHRDIFPDVAVLPTFNSHAIESALHRIPGLSRFFVYFNNDMLWGRRVSFFDYFRPLSRFRQALRNKATPKLHEVVAACDIEEVEAAGQHHKHTTTGRWTMLFEPIHYFENHESAGDVEVVNNAKAQPSGSCNATTQITRGDDRVRRNATTTNAAGDAGDDAVLYQHRDLHALFSQRFKQAASQRRRNMATERFRSLVNNNKNFLFESVAVGVGTVPLSFAHYPRLLDRAVMADMLDNVLAPLARVTRTHRTRRRSSLWSTMLCHYYHLIQRGAADVQWMTNWLVSSPTEDVSHLQTATRRRAEALVRRNRNLSTLLADLTIDDVLPGYWLAARRWSTLPMVDMLFSADVTAAQGYFRSSSTAEGELEGAQSVAQNVSVAESAADEAQRVSQTWWRSLCASSGAIVSAPRRAGSRRLGFEEECAAKTKSAKHLPQSPADGRIGDVVGKRRRVARKLLDVESGDDDYSMPPSTEVEKFDHFAVVLDSKSGMYHFCIMDGVVVLRRYIRELSHERKLFVTMNDDFGTRLMSSVPGLVHQLLQTASTATSVDPPAAPWEVLDVAHTSERTHKGV